jgi:hypothetical protein
MAKKKITAEIYSYGIFTSWERESKELPKIREITDRIPITPDVEFGCIIKIRGAKGKVIQFRIDHPPFKDSKGNPAAPFTGEYFINSNEYEFFLGDTVWEPYDDKAGIWELSTFLDGKRISYKKLTLLNNTGL